MQAGTATEEHPMSPEELDVAADAFVPPPYESEYVLPFPKAAPSVIPGGLLEECPDEPVFDPDVHLLLRDDSPLPRVVTLGDFAEHDRIPPVDPVERATSAGPLAFSLPFQFLSAEGVRVLRAVVDRERALARGNYRQPSSIRGLSYRSKFVRDLARSPRIARFFSQLAGEELVAHALPLNDCHTNIGQIGLDRHVDPWHADSVSYVCVCILSNFEGAEGGELQLIKSTRAGGFRKLHGKDDQVAPEDLLVVKYPTTGWGVFMQGSEIVHRVTPVKWALEPRMSVVFSFMPKNVFALDHTIYDTYKRTDGYVAADYEFARYTAKGAIGQLEALVNLDHWPEKPEILGRLDRVIALLQHTRELVAGFKSDRLPHFDDRAPADECDEAAGGMM